MTGESELVCTRHDAVLLARLNRPARKNALSLNLLALLGAAALEAESSPDIRVLVLTGTGDEVFCAGMDLREFASAESGSLPDDDRTQAFFRLMYGHLQIPVIAAVNGMAVGGGLELLLGCDVIVASATARFGLPEVKRGLFAGGSGTLLGTRIPLSVALEMALTGETIDAERAYALGLVNRVVAMEQVEATALDYAAQIAANGPLGLAATKELLRLASADPDAARSRAERWQQVVFASEDAKEGAIAFIEKRPPAWQGR